MYLSCVAFLSEWQCFILSFSIIMSMRMGSTHVWDYGNESPEEYLSDSELEGSSSDEDTEQAVSVKSKDLLLKQLISPPPTSLSTLPEGAESGTNKEKNEGCPRSMKKYAKLKSEESSCGANKSSLYDELPQLITAEPCAKRPSRHTPDAKPTVQNLQYMSYSSEDGKTVSFRLMDHIKPRVTDLAIALGFPQHVREYMETKRDQVYYILSEWLEGRNQENDERPLTWETLVTALQHAGLLNEAEILQQHFVDVPQVAMINAAAAAAAFPDSRSASGLKDIMRKKSKKSKKHRVRWTKSVLERMGMESFSVHHVRATDTNVISVQFGSLAEPSQWHTGDALFCSNKKCAAVVSHLTKLEGEDDIKSWICEFCGTKTTVDLVPEEIPTETDTTYLIEASAARPADQATLAAGGNAEESVVVFCIDTSGSMCVTTEVPGNYELKGDSERKTRFYRSASVDVGDVKDLELQSLQYLSQKQRKTTYLTNMQSVQAAIDTQLSFLARTQPNRRVCLVTFSSDVEIVGDSIIQPLVVAGDHLDNVDYLLDTAKEIRLPAPIKNTQQALSRKVFRLVEEGQTALGPALLMSIAIASRVPGSNVILCTDGLANVGLGKLDELKTDSQAQHFYDDMASLALKNSISVSLVSIRGQECRAADIGQVATRTGGHITIVDPLTVTEEFSSILANPVIATDTITRVVLHSGLYFRTEDTRESVICDIIGNVTAETELTYEFGVRKKIPTKELPPPAAASTSPSKETIESKSALESLEVAKDVWRNWKSDKDTSSQQQEKETKSGALSAATTIYKPTASEVPPLIINGQPHSPFQLQIEYTTLDGDRCLRVITQTKPVTKDKNVADRDADVNLVGAHAARKAADMVLQGQFGKYRAHSLQASKYIESVSDNQSVNFDRHISSLDDSLFNERLEPEPTEDATVHALTCSEGCEQQRMKPVRLHSNLESSLRHEENERVLPTHHISPRISDNIAERVYRVKLCSSST